MVSHWFVNSITDAIRRQLQFGNDSLLESVLTIVEFEPLNCILTFLDNADKFHQPQKNFIRMLPKKNVIHPTLYNFSY